MFRNLAIAISAFLFSGNGFVTAQENPDQKPSVKPNSEQLAFFENKIRPVLVAKCYSCHSANALAQKKLKGGLQVDTRAGLLKGGESGPAVVPGKVDESLLISALTHDSFKMPPSGKLADSVIIDFKKWVEMGAPDPRDGNVVATSTIDIEKGKEFLVVSIT